MNFKAGLNLSFLPSSFQFLHGCFLPRKMMINQPFQTLPSSTHPQKKKSAKASNHLAGCFQLFGRHALMTFDLSKLERLVLRSAPGTPLNLPNSAQCRYGIILKTCEAPVKIPPFEVVAPGIFHILFRKCSMKGLLAKPPPQPWPQSPHPPAPRA